MEDINEVIEESDEYLQSNELEIIKLELNDITDVIENILDEKLFFMNEKLLEIKREFQGKIKYDAKKDNMIDELHRELTAYRENLILNSIKPLILDLIYIKESHEKVIENLLSKEISELEPLKLLKNFEGFSSDIEDALYRQGIDSYSSEEEIFDGKKHKIIKAIETFDKEKDKKIFKSVRKGYIWGDKIIKKEYAYVYIYKELDIDTDDYCI